MAVLEPRRGSRLLVKGLWNDFITQVWKQGSGPQCSPLARKQSPFGRKVCGVMEKGRVVSRETGPPHEL